MSTIESLDLRERRRLQTGREICDAALDLFERHGVEATRVEDIARAAGVSPRTFFRYFPTKERAVFCKDPEMELLLADSYAQLTAEEPLLPQLEAIYVTGLALYENGRSASGRRLVRAWRLVVAEPALRLAALSYEEERNREVTQTLQELLGTDETDLEARMIVETVATTARVAFERWATGMEQGEDVDLLELYARSRELLRTLPG